MRSSGPGGQNVNKALDRGALRFDVRRRRPLPNDVAIRLMRIAGKRLTKDGVRSLTCTSRLPTIEVGKPAIGIARSTTSTQCGSMRQV